MPEAPPPEYPFDLPPRLTKESVRQSIDEMWSALADCPDDGEGGLERAKVEAAAAERELLRRLQRQQRLDFAAPALLQACQYPRHGDTAGLLEHAADMIDASVPDGWHSWFTPHLRRAAGYIRAAITLAEEGTR